MPYVTTLAGLAVCAVMMSIFVVQKLTQGFGTPEVSSIRDDGWALLSLSLEVLPVASMTMAGLVSLAGWGLLVLALPPWLLHPPLIRVVPGMTRRRL